MLLGTTVSDSVADPMRGDAGKIANVVEDHDLFDLVVSIAHITPSALIAELAAGPNSDHRRQRCRAGADHTRPGTAGVPCETEAKEYPMNPTSPWFDDATPVFDAIAATMSQSDDVVADSDRNPVPDAVAQASEDYDPDAEQRWIDQWYGDDPPGPDRGIDPYTVEGAAILRLFRMIKSIERDGWPGCDVVIQLETWFPSVGIDPDDTPMDAAQKLRLAARQRAPHCLLASDYQIHIGTPHPDAAAVIHAALADLVNSLGTDTTATVINAGGDQIAQLGTAPDDQ